MPAMTRRVVHVIDGGCDVDALSEALALSSPARPVVCLGPRPVGAEAARRAGETASVIPSVNLRRRQGIAADLSAGRLAACCFSLSAAEAIAAAAGDDACLRPAIRLARPPGPSGAASLSDLARRHEAVVAVPCATTAASLEPLLDAARIRQIPPPALPVDANRRAAVREALGAADGEAVFVAPGHVYRHSGHRFAVWAMAILAVAEWPVRLVFRATGPAARAVGAFAREAGFAGQTTIADADRFDAASLLSAADAAVFCGADAPPPVATATAIAAGRPIIAANIPAARDWLANGQTALLVPPENPRGIARALMALLDDPTLAERLASGARASSGRFEARAVRRRWDVLYNTIDPSGSTSPVEPPTARPL